MSYFWGLSGNDIDWDAVDGYYNETCVDCEHYKQETGEYPEECDGHTKRYSAKGWSFYHDTNSNFVSTVGHVPLSIYLTEYLVEWLDTLEGAKSTRVSAQRSRIRKALKYRPDYEHHAA